MNEHDKANLEFILACDKATLKLWYDSLTKDDLAYAEELIQAAQSELTMRLVALSDNVSDVSIAKGILDRFMLK